MHAKLIGKNYLRNEKEFLILKEATIGKGSQNDIVLSKSIISRKHARIYFDDKIKSFFLEDLDSRNGTKLDGEKVCSKEPLNNLHVITLCNKFDFFLQVSDDAVKESNGKVEFELAP